MAVTFKHKGDFAQTKQFLTRAGKLDIPAIVSAYAQEGVRALAAATPKDSGMTADSWSYDIERSESSWLITWNNNSVNKGFSIAIGIQYGHVTGTGGWREGIDYINPAMAPVFEKIVMEIWKEVTS